MRKTFTTTIVRDGAMSHFPVPFDPREVFGKLRAPVKVTLNGHTYRSTIFDMGGGPFLPLRQSNREGAGLEGGETLEVTLELDIDPRTVEPPEDLAAALKAHPTAWAGWRASSATLTQREYAEAVEEAKAARNTAQSASGLAVQASADKRGAKLKPEPFRCTAAPIGLEPAPFAPNPGH